MAQNPSPSHLDPGQIIKRSFNESDDRIRVDIGTTITVDGEQEVSITHVDDSIKVGDGVDLLSINSNGSANVHVVNKLIPQIWDYYVPTFPTATQEVHTFKSGGSGGSTVRTITINFTDSTKETISNLAAT